MTEYNDDDNNKNNNNNNNNNNASITVENCNKLIPKFKNITELRRALFTQRHAYSIEKCILKVKAIGISFVCSQT